MFSMEKITPLKQKRIEGGVGAGELAGSARITRQYLFKLERGDSVPTVPIAQRIALRLGCTLDELWPGEDSDAPSK